MVVLLFCLCLILSCFLLIQGDLPKKEKFAFDQLLGLQGLDCFFKPVHFSTGQHLIQRCVIIQRDEKGYGLTVTGDNPVYVQSVKDGKQLSYFQSESCL